MHLENVTRALGDKLKSGGGEADLFQCDLAFLKSLRMAGFCRDFLTLLELQKTENRVNYIHRARRDEANKNSAWHFKILSALNSQQY